MPQLDFWVLFWVGAVLGVKNSSEHQTLNSTVLTAIAEAQATTKRKEVQIDSVAANLGRKGKPLLVEIVLMVK